MMLMMLFLTLRPESLSKHKKGDDDYDYDASRMLELDDNKDQMLEEDNTRIPKWPDASSSTMFMAIQGDDGDNDDGAGRNPGPG